MPSNTYRGDIVVCKLTNQRSHGVDIIVDAAKKDGLVADGNARLQKLLASHLGHPGDLVGVVEVGMEGDGLACLLGLVGDADKGVDPAIRLIEDTAGGYGKTLGGKSETTDVRDTNQSISNKLQVLGHEIVRVPARHHDVVEAWLALNVSERLLPALSRRL